MVKQVKTMRVSGNEYAKVATRLLAFRSENPRASIKTSHVINPDGSTTFTTFILKDKADEYSADSTGSATYSAKEMNKPKAFEKLETISVGRALSLLGYLNNGEIASTEEMEEFESYQQQKQEDAIDEAIKALRAAKTIDELKQTFTTISSKIRGNPQIIAVKDELKTKLNNSGKEQDESNPHPAK